MPDNKNLLSQLGWEGATDEDYANEFGVNPQDPQFNQKIFDQVEMTNYQNYIAAGIPEAQARHKAKARKNKAMKELPKYVKM